MALTMCSRLLHAKSSAPITHVWCSPCTRASLRGRPRCSYGLPNRPADPRHVRIFDTTLRDGEQSPGVSLSSREKLDIAKHLAMLGVDVIEVGYPFATPDDMEAAKLIAKEVGNRPPPAAERRPVEEYENADDDDDVPVMCAFARCKKADIDAAWEAVKHASKPRILTFIATSDIHLQHKLRKTREEVVLIATEMVSYIKSLGCNDIEFGAEDAGRTNPRMLHHIFGEVIKAGATTICIADTVGSLLPNEYSQMISDIRANTAGAEDVIISAHCHNDLGLATANSLAAAAAGARQLEVTINGIGERAGNAPLEEVVMAIKYRGQDQMDGLFTGVQTKHITSISKLVADYTGMQVQSHKPIVGAHAFAHESGIHQDGMLKYRGTYEFLSPEDIGLNRTNLGIVLGKHSGRHGLQTCLMQLGHDIQGKALDEVFWEFKAMVAKQKKVSYDELEALVALIKSKPSKVNLGS